MQAGAGTSVLLATTRPRCLIRRLGQLDGPSGQCTLTGPSTPKRQGLRLGAHENLGSMCDVQAAGEQAAASGSEGLA